MLLRVGGAEPQNQIGVGLLYRGLVGRRGIYMYHHQPSSSAADFIHFQNDINILNAWILENHLSLNLTKTKFMFISKKRKIPFSVDKISIQGFPIERVSTFKYLGIIISEDLSWSAHIDHIVTNDFIFENSSNLQVTTRLLLLPIWFLYLQSLTKPSFVP